MALFDDRRFLLSHINHSFITGDDTGLCEVVMLDEDVFENQHQRCLKLEGQSENEEDNSRLAQEAYDLNYESDLIDSEQGQSYDIISDMDYICHRRRSNTAQRLERLRKEKLNQSKTKTIVWRSSNVNIPSEDRSSQDSPNEQDEKDSEEPEKVVKKELPRKSGLTRLLEKYPSLPKNPFDEYAQFDGSMSETVHVNKIMIFIALNQSNNNSNEPMEIVIVSSAKVQDLIGLICWQYTNEGREPRLTGHINDYCLRIAEDNGEVDPDFTSLNPKEPLSKFNFPSLALTEKADEKTTTYQNGTGSVTSHNIPSLCRYPVISSTTKVSTYSKLAAFTRIIFRDAKLESD